MLDYIKAIYTEAKTKVTTYVALGIAAAAQVADRSEDIYNSFPALRGFLPQSKHIDSAAHWAITVLGFLVVWTRVRRMLTK